MGSCAASQVTCTRSRPCVGHLSSPDSGDSEQEGVGNSHGHDWLGTRAAEQLRAHPPPAPKPCPCSTQGAGLVPPGWASVTLARAAVTVNHNVGDVNNRIRRLRSGGQTLKSWCQWLRFLLKPVRANPIYALPLAPRCLLAISGALCLADASPDLCLKLCMMSFLHACL